MEQCRFCSNLTIFGYLNSACPHQVMLLFSCSIRLLTEGELKLCHSITSWDIFLFRGVGLHLTIALLLIKIG